MNSTLISSVDERFFDDIFYDETVYNLCMSDPGLWKSRVAYGSGPETVSQPVSHLLSQPVSQPVSQSEPKPITKTYKFLHSEYFVPTMQNGEPYPALQPSAGIYTSSLTMNTMLDFKDLVVRITQTLKALRLAFSFDEKKFKFEVVGYFTSGFARFTVRIWSRLVGDFAIEVMRERGDRIFVTRVFDSISSIINEPDASSAISANIKLAENWTPDMFNWLPIKLPAEIIAKLPRVEAEASTIASEIASIISQVSSLYDDIAISGCALVATLVTVSETRRNNMAGSRDLIFALTRVLISKEAYSLDTRTMAALALTELIKSECFETENMSIADFTRLVEMSTEEGQQRMYATESYRVKSHELYYLIHYCGLLVSKIRVKDM
jgi:hypothetical protein